MKKTAILILAAGKSSRMGSTKQLLSYKKTTLLGWAIEQAKQSKANTVFCVLGANSEIIEKSIENYLVETIYNVDYNNGLSTSIIAGINHLKDKNEIVIDSGIIDGPMVYPFFQSDKDLKTHLITNRIFVSTYWPECLDRAGITKDEVKLVQTLVSLPCDQRNTLIDNIYILKVINNTRNS